MPNPHRRQWFHSLFALAAGLLGGNAFANDKPSPPKLDQPIAP